MSESEKLTQADDNFCEELYQDYMNSSDKNESYSLEDCKFPIYQLIRTTVLFFVAIKL